MNLPFAPEQFFAVFARYNQTVWPMQIVLNAAALLCIGLLLRANARASRAIYLILSFLWAWMAIAYHFAFFSEVVSSSTGVGRSLFRRTRSTEAISGR